MTPSNANEEDPPGTPFGAEPAPADAVTRTRPARAAATAVAPPADVAPELHDGGDR